MDRIEQNSLTLHYDQDHWSLPLRFDLLRTAHWENAHASHFEHMGAEIAFNRIFMFRQGGCRIRWGTRTHRLRHGLLYLLPLAAPFKAYYPQGCEIFAFHFHFSTSTGRDVFRQCTEIQRLDAPLLFQEIAVGMETPGIQGTLGWQSALFQAACRFAGPLMSDVFEQEKQARDFKELLEYIQTQATPLVTIAQLARRMKTTRAALSKRFARVMGMPLKDCLIQSAMRKAEALVVRQDLTVQEIAHQLGYRDSFYFHRVFKKHTGLTPLEYRKRVGLHC